MAEMVQALSKAEGPLSLLRVLEEEFKAIHGALPEGYPTNGMEEERLAWLRKLQHRKGQVALSLSGGGIRSATLGLGVMQSLARLKLLSQIDYLS
ncbi:MAG TPA: hypothetical protein VJ483_10740, partial [Holophagaceae bacterium]|nr:hypothetical protein [Holophagaceae bacterium]